MSGIGAALQTGLSNIITFSTVNVVSPTLGASVGTLYALINQKHKTDDDWWTYAAIGALSGFTVATYCRMTGNLRYGL